jgi:hypothetical protein
LRIANWSEELGDDEAALARYRQALQLTPEDTTALERFAAVAARHGDAADAIGAYRRVLAATGGPSDRRRRAAQQLLQLLVIIGDRDQAHQLLATLKDEPAPDVLMGLARLEEACDDLAAAADLWARAAAQLDGQHAAAAEIERARVCRAWGHGDDEQAALARAFALAPTGQEGLAAASGLIRLARATGDTTAEAAWLDRLMACAPSPPGASELLLRRAQLFLDGGDGASAAALLEQLRAAGYDGPAARRLAADVRGALGDAAGRAAALEALALDSDGAERLRLWVAAAQSRLDAGDLDAASDDARAAAGIATDEPAVRALMAELAWRRGDWEQVVERCDELMIDAVGDARVTWARRRAIADDRLGRTRDAVTALEDAIGTDDAGGEPLAEAWRELGLLREQLGDSSAAVATLRSGGSDARVGSPSLRAQLLRAAATILHRRLGRHDEAAALLAEALALAPTELDALEALDVLQSEIGDDAGLMATLTRKLALPAAPDEARQKWLERLGTLAATHDDTATARAAFSELLARDPAHAGALRWLAADAAASGGEGTLANGADELDARLAVAASVPPEERRAARLRMATRAQRDHRLADAETQLWAAVELSSNEQQPPLLAELEEVYTQAARWADLAVVLNHHASIASDEGERLALDLRRARVLLHELLAPHLALEAAQAAIARHGSALELVALLADAARAAEKRSLLADTLATQASMTVDARERARLLAEAAALLAQLGQVERAQTLTRELTAADVAPIDRLALADLVEEPTLALELARAAAATLPTGEAEATWHLVLARARVVGDEAAERDALKALWQTGAAPAERERLLALFEAAGDSDDACALLHQLLVEAVAAGGDPAPLVARLRAAAGATTDLARLADGLERAAAATSENEAAAAWLREAASLRAGLDDFASAATALLAALARCPGDETLMADVETLLGDLGDRTRLRGALELHLGTHAGEARLPTLRKLGRLCEELGDDEAVQQYLGEARRLEPTAAARVNVRALVRTIAETPARADEAQLRAAIAETEARLRALLADDVRAVRAVRRRLGELYRDAGRLSDAFAQLAAVLTEEPSNVMVLRALVDVAECDGRWLDAARLLDRLSHLVSAANQRAALLYRAGELHLQRLGDRDAATSCYLRAIDLDPTHAPTLRRLIDYFFREGDDASVADMATALDAQEAFAVAETTTGTRARAALATAIAGDFRCAVRLGAALDTGTAATALAHVAVERVARGHKPESMAQALRLLCEDETLAAVQRRLSERGRSDAGAAALAALLDEPIPDRHGD